MKSMKTPAIVAGLSAALLISAATLRAQEERRNAGAKNRQSISAEATALVALQKKGKKKRKKARGRLPNYYKKSGVTKKQTEQIYSIQVSYREKIESLEEQLADLKAKRSAEIEAILTPEQKKKVEQFQEAARKKREARKKKKEKEKE